VTSKKIDSAYPPGYDAKVDYLLVAAAWSSNHLDEVVQRIGKNCAIPTILSRQSFTDFHAMRMPSCTCRLFPAEPELLIASTSSRPQRSNKAGWRSFPPVILVIDGGAPTQCSYISNAAPYRPIKTK